MRELEQLLGITSSVPDTETAITKIENNYAAVFDEKDSRFIDDFEIVRDNIMSILTDTKQSVKALNLIARDSEKSTDFIALGNLTKTLLEANRQLLELYEIKKDYAKGSEQKNINIGTMNNAIFTGTTKDLKKFNGN